MRSFVIFLFYVFSMVVFMLCGVYEAQKSIKNTCDDPTAQTAIQGKIYMCVTKEQWNEVAERIFQMGVVIGAKRARSET